VVRIIGLALVLDKGIPKKPNPKDPYRPNPPPKISVKGDGGVTVSEQSLLAGGGYSVAFRQAGPG